MRLLSMDSQPTLLNQSQVLGSHTQYLNHPIESSLTRSGSTHHRQKLHHLEKGNTHDPDSKKHSNLLSSCNVTLTPSIV